MVCELYLEKAVTKIHADEAMISIFVRAQANATMHVTHITMAVCEGRGKRE